MYSVWRAGGLSPRIVEQKRRTLAIGEGVPVNVPKLWNGSGKFEMSAKTLKARLMREPFPDDMQMIFHRPRLGTANINTLPLSAFFTTNLNVHSFLGHYSDNYVNEGETTISGRAECHLVKLVGVC